LFINRFLILCTRLRSAPGNLLSRIGGCRLIAVSNPLDDCYRLVLVPPSALRIFAVRTHDALRLPRISIPRWTRAAEQVQAAIEETFGFRVIVLDFLCDRPGYEDVMIAELRGHGGTASLPHSHSWVRLSDLAEDEFSGFERWTIGRLLEDGATVRGTFSRSRWIEEALDWVAAEAKLDRAQFTDDIKQLNAAADCALVRFGRRGASPIWFKAAGPGASGEYRITTMLAELFPEFLPALLTSREDWGAWWTEDAGRSLDDLRSPEIFRDAALRLAALQKTSIQFVPDLVAGACGDQRLSVLRARIPQMLELIDEAMTRPGSSHGPRLGKKRLDVLGSILGEACLSLEALGVPDTLIHSDLNFGNILVGPRGCVFTDWAGAAVGNPFLNFEHLRAQMAQETDIAPRMAAIYLESWSEVLADSQIEDALALVPPIAIVSHLSARWGLLTFDRRRDPQFQSYVRAVARQIDRAARALEFTEVRCA
jgi:hypothetical protein